MPTQRNLGSRTQPFNGVLRDANLLSERVKCVLQPDAQGRPNHNWPVDLYGAFSDACEGVGTDLVAAAFEVTAVSCFTEMRERSALLLASARAAGHAATLGESCKTLAFLNRVADIRELLTMKYE
jgi:hypothetical protein